MRAEASRSGERAASSELKDHREPGQTGRGRADGTFHPAALL